MYIRFKTSDTAFDFIFGNNMVGPPVRPLASALAFLGRFASQRRTSFALGDHGRHGERGDPYTVTEQNFAVRCLQPKKERNRHAVFFTHTLEAINYRYERNPADPRITHTLTLEVDDFGNVLKKADIGYGRRKQIRIVEEDDQVIKIPNPKLNELPEDDQEKQTKPLITYTENDVTDPIDLPSDDPGL